MRYYLIAGEASGDLHASNLIRAIRQKDRQAEIRGWGGGLMEEAGAQLVKHYRDLAFMGFAEVIANLPTILRNIKFCKQDIQSFKPDVVVFIDYPGFNIRIATWAREQGLKTVWYISPQVWAWKSGRVKTLKKCIDKMIVILPFEQEYYRRNWNWEVEYAGHPLIPHIDAFIAAGKKNGDAKKVVAVLPGSRKQEITVKLPVMLKAAEAFTQEEFVVAMAPGMDPLFYEPFLRGKPNVKAVQGKTYNLLLQSKAAIVTSGTATLETALFGVPEVVCYKGSPVSFAIAKRLVDIKYISLVNLIMDKPVVEELIQDRMTTENIIQYLEPLLTDTVQRRQMLADYEQLYALLIKEGDPLEAAAESIVSLAEKS